MFGFVHKRCLIERQIYEQWQATTTHQARSSNAFQASLSMAAVDGSQQYVRIGSFAPPLRWFLPNQQVDHIGSAASASAAALFSSSSAPSAPVSTSTATSTSILECSSPDHLNRFVTITALITADNASFTPSVALLSGSSNGLPDLQPPRSDGNALTAAITWDSLMSRNTCASPHVLAISQCRGFGERIAQMLPSASVVDCMHHEQWSLSWRSKTVNEIPQSPLLSRVLYCASDAYQDAKSAVGVLLNHRSTASAAEAQATTHMVANFVRSTLSRAELGAVSFVTPFPTTVTDSDGDITSTATTTTTTTTNEYHPAFCPTLVYSMLDRINAPTPFDATKQELQVGQQLVLPCYRVTSPAVPFPGDREEMVVQSPADMMLGAYATKQLGRHFVFPISATSGVVCQAYRNIRTVCCCTPPYICCCCCCWHGLHWPD
jgi:hypothetical protein